MRRWLVRDGESAELVAPSAQVRSGKRLLERTYNYRALRNLGKAARAAILAVPASEQFNCYEWLDLHLGE